MHWTLAPKTNVFLVVVWVCVAIVLIWFYWLPYLWASFMVGAVVGLAAGMLQHEALRVAPEKLVHADSVLAIRDVLRSSLWGSAYLRVFWIGALLYTFVALALFDRNWPVGFVAGYLGKALVRDAITLPDTFWLARQKR